MYSANQGIPGLPDLTHPTELIQIGSQLLPAFLFLVFLIIALGVAIALISFALRAHPLDQKWSLGNGLFITLSCYGVCNI